MDVAKRRVARTCRVQVSQPRHIDRSAALTEDVRRIGAVAAADAHRTRRETETTPVTTAPQWSQTRINGGDSDVIGTHDPDTIE
ncbi:MAG: hypothetical protein ACM3ML_14015 [Micromonosporaceae bacterium]